MEKRGNGRETGKKSKLLKTHKKKEWGLLLNPSGTHRHQQPVAKMRLPTTGKPYRAEPYGCLNT
jgi:hypothetical protein